LLKRHCWQTRGPFSLYLGWISVATIANVSVLLYSLNWNGFGLSDLAWTVIMMLVAVILSALMLKRFNDFLFAGVIMWALLGISVKNPSLSAIQTTAFLGISLLALYSLYLLFNYLRRSKFNRVAAKAAD